ncbi:MAG: aldose 1-epimerase family protein [Oscillospiraceae bacterium]|nr:aldose 1-epimerase family protein [Oscillospiraceae bacterium]
MISIENDVLSVQLSPKGGTLQSIFHKKNGREYLWQGDRAYWGGRAPNLFPFVGRLYQERYTYDGRSYPMKCHGFLGKTELEEKQTAPDCCAFLLTDSTQTRAIYPFHFFLRLEYKLEDNRIHVCYRVKNTGTHTMYCGFGGHPGFRIPLEEGLAFEDYQVSFPGRTDPKLVCFSGSVLTADKIPYELEDGCKLRMNHGLFCFDAVVFADCGREVTLSSPKGQHGVTVRYQDMPYVGFWHKPNTDAPFLCIEPWSVLPGREGIVEDIASMADMTAIAPQETATIQWSIEIF